MVKGQVVVRTAWVKNRAEEVQGASGQLEKQPKEALVEKVSSAGGMLHLMVVEEANAQAWEMKSKGPGHRY